MGPRSLGKIKKRQRAKIGPPELELLYVTNTDLKV